LPLVVVFVFSLRQDDCVGSRLRQWYVIRFFNLRITILFFFNVFIDGKFLKCFGAGQGDAESTMLSAMLISGTAERLAAG